MKKIMILMGFLLPMLAHADPYVGNWYTTDQEGTVNITQVDGVYSATLLGSGPGTKSGQSEFDVNNVDESLRTRRLIGLKLIDGLRMGDNGVLEGGTVYDPKKGKVFKCKVWLEDGVLKVRGFKGFFHRTVEWTDAPG